MGSWGGEDERQGSDWRTSHARRQLADWGVPPLHDDIPGGTTGGEQDRLLKLSAQETEGSKPLTVKICGGCSGGRNSQSRKSGENKKHCSFSDPSHHNAAKRLPRPCEYLRLLSLQLNRCTKTKKYGPNERTDQNSRKRIKWWWDRQPIWCRVQIR